MQNLRVEWPAIKERGVYLRAYSAQQKMALIDTEDLGEAAAQSPDRAATIAAASSSYAGRIA